MVGISLIGYYIHNFMELVSGSIISVKFIHMGWNEARMSDGVSCRNTRKDTEMEYNHLHS